MNSLERSGDICPDFLVVEKLTMEFYFFPDQYVGLVLRVVKLSVRHSVRRF